MTRRAISDSEAVVRSWILATQALVADAGRRGDHELEACLDRAWSAAAALLESRRARGRGRPEKRKIVKSPEIVENARDFEDFARIFSLRTRGRRIINCNPTSP